MRSYQHKTPAFPFGRRTQNRLASPPIRSGGKGITKHALTMPRMIGTLVIAGIHDFLLWAGTPSPIPRMPGASY
jgi:hypothetical protein